MARLENNRLLHPTKRIIENWKTDFRASDGPNNSTFIDLLDIGIPYDSHYRSRIVLPADTENFFLNYGTLENVSFLLIKITYNGNYDYAMEDGYDPLYNQEPNTYNITYYYEGNSGVTYPIGRLLLLTGSLNNKLQKIYLNNTLDYDVVLDVLHADVSPAKTIIPSGDIVVTNLYYNDIITDKVSCDYNLIKNGDFSSNLDHWDYDILSGVSETSAPIVIDDNFCEFQVGGGLGEDNYKFQQIFTGLITNTPYKLKFTMSSNIDCRVHVDIRDFTNDNRIGFSVDPNAISQSGKSYFYYDLTSTSTEYEFDILNFDDILPNTEFSLNFLLGGQSDTKTLRIDDVSLMITGDTAGGSTKFIINTFLTGHTSIDIPYNTIITLSGVGDRIYLDTYDKKYILKFLTEYDLNNAYYRLTHVYESNNCTYLTVNHIYENGIIVDNNSNSQD